MPPEAIRLTILAGLLKLQKKGVLAAIYATDRLRVQLQPYGLITHMSWPAAAELVAAHAKLDQEAAAGQTGTIRKGPASEGLKRAAAATGGQKP